MRAEEQAARDARQQDARCFADDVLRLNLQYRALHGRDRAYCIRTFGCQMNEHDSEVLAGLLQQMGFVPAAREEDADLLLFNTCCIREKAESKVLSHLGELRALKQKRPDCIIGVCGCMMQQQNEADLVRASAPHVDLIFGTHNLQQLPRYLLALYRGAERQVEIWPQEEPVQEGLPVRRAHPYQALVNIIYGCNNFCTYCVVPYVRGRERSRRQADIAAEVRRLVADGVVEVTLLGQNVNSYGTDLADGTSFAGLLRELDGIEGLRRIRFMTSHPKDFTDELVRTIADSRKVCDHVHLPVQSGSSRILQRMNRRYSKETYLRLVERIRRALPGAAITTDLIVGFPGETEEDFQETLDLVRRVRFDTAFTFLYSKRSGTPAARMEDPVSPEEKKERLQRLNTLQSEISREINDTLVGRTVDVLVEGGSKTDAAMLQGRTTTNKTVLFAGDPALAGKILPVRVAEAQTWVLKGELAD